MSTATVQESAVSIDLDPMSLASLGDLLDHDLAAWNELLQTQLSNSARLASELRSAFEVSDWFTLERAAHTLKSSSALFGAHKLAQQCQVVELAAHHKLTATLADQTAELLTLFAQTDAALRQLVGRVP